jgi:BolA protein
MEVALQVLAPELLIVEDQSEAHRGHAGYQEGGESHFHVVIKSAALNGSRIANHRAIHSAIGAELVAEIHALSITIN